MVEPKSNVIGDLHKISKRFKDFQSYCICRRFDTVAKADRWCSYLIWAKHGPVNPPNVKYALTLE